MSEMPNKFILIDGKNLCCRLFYADTGLHKGNKPTDVVYGFFRQLINLHKRYPSCYIVVAWDGGYDRRLAESKVGVAAGIVPEAYKENRVKKAAMATGKDAETKESLDTQTSQVQDMLNRVRCTQVMIDGEEADDIINTYTKKYPQCQFVILSSDKDFYQLISDTVVVYNGMKDETWDRKAVEATFGVTPDLWVEVGALAGDDGDNIYGADGWGIGTACKYIRAYRSVERVLEAVAAKKKRGVREESLLACVPRLMLARSLKQMHIVPNVPDISPERKDVEEIKKMFCQWGFVSLLRDAWLLA